MKALFPWILLAAMIAIAPSRAQAQSLPGDSVYQVDIHVTDQQGARHAWRDLRGRPAVVSMFYTQCHMMCPLILESAKSVSNQLSADERKRLDFAMLSLDPANDTPQAMRETAQRHRTPDGWRFLTPDANDVRAIASVLDIRYRARSDGSINHTSALVLIDGDGRILARTEIASAVADPEFVAAVRKAITAP